MLPFLFVCIVVLALAYGLFLGRLYTGFALPSLHEDPSFLPSRQIEQMKRYLDGEALAGRKRWHHGLARHALAIQTGLIVLLLAAVFV